MLQAAPLCKGSFNQLFIRGHSSVRVGAWGDIRISIMKVCGPTLGGKGDVKFPKDKHNNYMNLE